LALIRYYQLDPRFVISGHDEQAPTTHRPPVRCVPTIQLLLGLIDTDDSGERVKSIIVQALNGENEL